MADGNICGVCEKNEASTKCEVCEIALCDMCKKSVVIESQKPGSKSKADVSASAIRAASWKKIVCPKCMEEADFY